MKVEYEKNIIERLDQLKKESEDKGKVISRVLLNNAEWTNLIALSSTPGLEIFGGSAVYRGLHLELDCLDNAIARS